jgi:hypothetical protein
MLESFYITEPNLLYTRLPMAVMTATSIALGVLSAGDQYDYFPAYFRFLLKESLWVR